MRVGKAEMEPSAMHSDYSPPALLPHSSACRGSCCFPLLPSPTDSHLPLRSHSCSHPSDRVSVLRADLFAPSLHRASRQQATHLPVVPSPSRPVKRVGSSAAAAHPHIHPLHRCHPKCHSWQCCPPSPFESLSAHLWWGSLDCQRKARSVLWDMVPSVLRSC